MRRGYEYIWNNLLKLLIAVGLNLVLVYFVPEINDAKGMLTQTSLSLKELKPFTTKRGVVLTKKLVQQ
jgi:hypothetical protein